MIDKKDNVLKILGLGSSVGAVGLILFLYYFILQESLPVILNEGFYNIIFSTEWQPDNDEVKLGILTMIISTLWVAIGAVAISVPISIAGGIFLAEFAPKKLSNIIRIVIIILTGIPSVVYGFLGASLIIPAYEKIFDVGSGEALLCASLVLAVMITPYIVTGTYAAFKLIPGEYRDNALVLGVSKPHVLNKIILPMAKQNIINTVLISLSRAVGETMAVLMIAGNTLTMPLSWFDKGETLSALIALEMGSAVVGSVHYQGLFLAGLVLLILITIINFSVYYYQYKRGAI